MERMPSVIRHFMKISYATSEEVEAAIEEVMREHRNLFRMLAGNYTDTEHYQMHERELKSIKHRKLQF